MKVTCNNLKLCVRLEEVIEGAIHTVWRQWKGQATDQGNGDGGEEDGMSQDEPPLPKGDAEGLTQGLLTHPGEEGMEDAVATEL